MPMFIEMSGLFGRFRHLSVIFWIVLTQWFGLASISYAANEPERISAPSLTELQGGISDRLKRVEEFRFIEEEAKRRGFRAWLFGGTAAGFGHYVKWDLQREKGDPRFQPDRFDYDYTNIYRSTQDLDIVIDGDASQARSLQDELAQKYPHLQGSKTAWEVRLLTKDMGDKQAILNNPDFMNQHTDSNSTGMIELTQPKHGESVVRDVRDWHASEPYFLKDLQSGSLHYYFSPLHGTTKFAKEGRNPPIVSVIRYLTKALQYELKMSPEDLQKVSEVIRQFNPKNANANSYVAQWIEKNGKKLMQNAVNLEYAWNVLEETGLRKKLIAIKSNTNEVDSLAWWLNKEPLRSAPLGAGSGKTARELGLDIVAHETQNFLAYESITLAHTGDPNVLISRAGAAGEAAVHGNGFYTQKGRAGARGTGLTIRFHLDPAARENTDFIRAAGNFVIVKNKAALKVIPESLNADPVEYFRILAGKNVGLNATDLGRLEKLKRRAGAKINSMTEQELGEVVALVKNDLEPGARGFTPVLKAWFSLPISRKFPEFVDELQNRSYLRSVKDEIVEHILTQPHWSDRRDLVEAIAKSGKADLSLIQYILSRPEWTNRPDLVANIINKRNTYANGLIAVSVLNKPYWKNHPELVSALIQSGTSDEYVASHVLTQPHWQGHSELVKELLNAGKVDYYLAAHVFPLPIAHKNPEWIETVFQRGNSATKQAIIDHVFTQKYWKNHPRFKNLIRAQNVVLAPDRFMNCVIGNLNRLGGISPILKPAVVVPVAMTAAVGGTMVALDIKTNSAGYSEVYDAIQQSAFSEMRDPACRPSPVRLRAISKLSPEEQCRLVLKTNCYDLERKERTEACADFKNSDSIETLALLASEGERLEPEHLRALARNQKPVSKSTVRDSRNNRNVLYRILSTSERDLDAAKKSADQLFIRELAN
jgi:hypothetical protein